MEEQYDVSFSQRAVERLDTIVAYLGENWSGQIKTDFLSLVTDKIHLISRMPYMYRASATMAGCRECVINGLTVLYYQVNEETKTVEIITIQSNRMGNLPA